MKNWIAVLSVLALVGCSALVSKNTVVIERIELIETAKGVHHLEMTLRNTSFLPVTLQGNIEPKIKGGSEAPLEISPFDELKLMTVDFADPSTAFKMVGKIELSTGSSDTSFYRATGSQKGVSTTFHCPHGRAPHGTGQGEDVEGHCDPLTGHPKG